MNHQKPALIDQEGKSSSCTPAPRTGRHERQADSTGEPAGRALDTDHGHHGSAFVGWMPSKDQKSSCNCARMAHWPSSPGSSVRKPALLATNAPAASDEKL